MPEIEKIALTLQSIFAYGRKMKHIYKPLSTMLLSLLLIACNGSETAPEAVSRKKTQAEDLNTINVAVMPTLDCLPLYVAEASDMFSRNGLSVNLMTYTSQMDCDTAIQRGWAGVSVSDKIRADRMAASGSELQYLFYTDTYWQLIANSRSRIHETSQLGNKMVAIARYSATDTYATMLIGRARAKADVFKVQVNDVSIRLKMLQNNSVDAAMLTEPYATVARQNGHNVLADSRNDGLRYGVFVAAEEFSRQTAYRQKLDRMKKIYDSASDSIRKYGYMHYKDILKDKYRLTEGNIKMLEKDLRHKTNDKK